MKKFLLRSIFFILALNGCNNPREKGTGVPSTIQGIGEEMVDLTASTDIQKLLCQDWENKEDAQDAALSGGDEGLEIPYRGFSFFEDATFVEDPRDKMRFGKWTMNDSNKIIHMTFSNGGRAKYKIVAIGARQMILMETKDKKKIVYRADAKMHKQPADDPFHGSNNQWRIKPGRPEPDSIIRRRTEQCVLFYAKFLEDNASRGGNVISFVGLPNCFKWYRGGISLTNKDKLEAKWINCFYNRDQAMKAHTLLESVISKKYKWDKEEKSWVKQSAGVVKQLYDTLRLL